MTDSQAADPAAVADSAAGPAALADSPGTATGDPRVDAAVARLDGLDDAPTGEHVAVYEDVHRRLHDALADLAADGP